MDNVRQKPNRGSTKDRYRFDAALSQRSSGTREEAEQDNAHASITMSHSEDEADLMSTGTLSTTRAAAGAATARTHHLQSMSSSDGYLLLNGPDTTDYPSIPRRNSLKTMGPTTELSKKELALRKKKSKSSQMQRRDSLDLLDPEVDAVPGMDTTLNRAGDWVIDPDSGFVTYWLALIYCITVYNVIVIPFRMSFGLLNNTIGFWFLFDQLTDLFFIADIYLHHHIGVYIKGRKILNLKTIAAHYRSTWGLPVDIFASMPLDLIQIPARSIVPSARLPRLLRGFHILELINSIENQPGVNVVFVRLVKLAMFTIFLNHFAACFWYAFGYSMGSFNAWTVSNSIQQLPTISQYIRAMYWAMTQMFGRGIPYPVALHGSESLMILFYVIAAALFYIYIMATAISLVEQSNTIESAFQMHVNYIMTFLRDQGLPTQLQTALQEYFSYLWLSKRGHDTGAVMELLPSSIAQDIQMFLVKGIVIRCRMFSQIDQSALTAIVNMLTPRVYAPGEYITHTGVLHPSMYFIQQGELEVLSTKYRKTGEPSIEQLISLLVTGDAFGEMQLFLELPPLTSIRAKTFCQLYEFTHDNLHTLIQVYPTDGHLLVRTAKQMRHLTEDEDPNGAIPSLGGVVQHKTPSSTGSAVREQQSDGGKAASQPAPSLQSRVDDDSAVKVYDGDIEKGMVTSGRMQSDVTMSEHYFARSRKSSASVSRRHALESILSVEGLPPKLISRWEGVLILAVLYNLIVIPIRAGVLRDDTRNAWPFLAFDVVADLLLLFDMALRYRYAAQFTEARPASGKQCENTKAAAQLCYVRQYLPIYMLASFPIDWALITVRVGGVPVNIVMRLLRFLRIGTVTAILFRNVRNLKSNAHLMFLRTVLMFVILAHILTILHAFAFDPPSDSLLLRYTTSLTIVINSLTGLGRTGLLPTNEVQMVTAMVMYICGVWIMALCIGSLISYVTERNSLEGRFSRNMLSTQRFLDFANVPEEIQTRTRVYFESMWSTMRGIVPQQALSTLPSSLRTKIMIELCRNVIKNMPIFQGVSDRFIYDLVPNLEYEVFPAMEYIFRRGQMQNGKMYFVTRGILSIILDETISTKPFKLIGTGSFFGECALLTSSSLRRASIRTETLCHVLSITKPRLMSIFSLYPIFGDRMKQMATQRVKRLDKTQKNMQQILVEIMSRIEDTKLIANRTYDFIMYEACFVGSELVDWIIQKGYADNREDAIAIGVALLEKGMIRSVAEHGANEDAVDNRFVDGLQFYRLRTFVDRIANTDMNVVRLDEMITEDFGLMNDLQHRLIVDESFDLEENLISARSLMNFLLSTTNVLADPKEMEAAECRAEQLAQRLIDLSILQSLNGFEIFENNDVNFYRLRALNPSDPQSSGPAASATLLSGKTPAFSGILLLRATFTFITYFGIISTGYPSIIHLYISKRSDRPVRILQTCSSIISVSQIEFANSDIKLSCIHLTVVDAPDKVGGSVSTDKRRQRSLVFCFDRQLTYQWLLEILKAQGYSQKIRGLVATPWSTMTTK